MIKFLFLLLSIPLITNCASMADATNKLAGLGVIKEDVSTFDNTKIIEVTPNWLYGNGSWGNAVKMGARWNDKDKDFVALVFSYNSSTMFNAGPVFMSINGVDINIDGEILSYKADTHTTYDHDRIQGNTYTDSKNSVYIPYDVLKKMVSAKSCKLRVRIRGNKEYEEADFLRERMPGGGSTAVLSIRKFIDKIESNEQAITHNSDS